MEISSEPGWFADPRGRHAHRWWSGTYWTEHVADGGQVGIDPLDSPATEAATTAGAAPVAQASASQVVATTNSAPPPLPGPSAAQPPAGSASPKRQQWLIGGAIAGAAALVIGGIVLFTGGSDGDGGSLSAPAGGATAATWCVFVDEADALGEMSFDPDPSQLQEEIAEAESIVQRLRSEAPDEITDAAKKLADVNQSLFDAIKAADYDMFDADFSFMEDPAVEPDLEAALETLDAYTERECGRPFDEASDDFDDSDDFDITDGTMREQLATVFESAGFTSSEATCVTDAVDFSDPAVLDGDVGAMLDGVYEQCDISPERVAELRLVSLGGG